MQLQRLVLLTVFSAMLTACALTPQQNRDTSSIEAMQRELSALDQPAAPSAVQAPDDVIDALLPSLMPEQGGYAQERFDVRVSRVNARDFFMGLVKDTGFNMVVHPDVKGEISLELSAVTIDEVMDVARDVYGYPIKKRGNLYQVLPGGLRAEVFKIDYLSIKRRGVSETRVSAGEVSSAGSSSTGTQSDDANDSDTGSQSGSRGAVTGSQVRTATEADFWSELQRTLTVLIGHGEGRSVVVTPQAGIVVVRALPEEREMVRQYLRKAELIMRRQVVLEAKILEVELNDGFQSGINWSELATSGADNSATFTMNSAQVINGAGRDGVFSINFDLDGFAGVVELLETQGSVQVLSSPRISTVNNQKAVIKVGQDEFFVTEVSNSTTVSNGSTTSNPDVELTPFFSGIALDVTPQISETDEIILHIHPSISQVEDQTKLIDVGGELLELPLALSTIRETDSVVFARSGQIVVLGGLMQNTALDSNAGAPWLGRVPMLGHLFSQQRSRSKKSELVILLKPVVVGTDGAAGQLRAERERLEGYRRALEGEQSRP